ncbi:flavin reductase family protein [Planosporangium mesophilum]|uniref:Flavin oxidoreductase n=1 Tax=Planosporangium mesophilum TaxID=689768 RepID=A0A8J3TDS2_9ACTN|nr:flavin reductase family protein [Planosporangium mesophilum]NJC86284.1 flavin reductase family protein [Planosporangium mesophilum]GII23307.1 flavin oxidoreductase [Planosporangium mesophilum]
MTIDGRMLRNCLGRFATGVTVVTYEADGEVHGLTVNAFTAVSLEPSLVLVSLDRRSRACGKLEDRPFAVNILAAGQHELALHFAGRPQRDLVVGWGDAIPGRPPRLAGCAAYFDCRPWRCYDGGDHVLFLGEVETVDVNEDSEPLIFYGGRFRSVGGFAEALLQPTFVGDPGWLGEAHQFNLPSCCARHS